MNEPPLSPLIKTKLLSPQLRQQWVRRARITGFLNNALQYPLTLVSSLAGSGKTTALVEWVNQLPIPAAWFSIDEGDNDFNRFLLYFITALQTIVPGTGRAVLESIGSPASLPIENLMGLLINDLSDKTGDFVLVLDDYHLIKSRAVQQALAFFIEHNPDAMHLVISTRADPNLPLARYRARNRVLELRIDRLRFTPAEVTEYLNRVMRLNLSESNIDILRARTEGWIASLQMAALSLQGQTNQTAYIQAFTGGNRYILDYLVEEVLNRQPEKVQSFLLQTSILERMCGPLCDALCEDILSGEDSGQKMLEYLERSNLFLVPLDEERGWYRYHHLFTDLLRARLAHSPQGQNQRNLHTRASVWFEKNGFTEEAVRHALATRDYLRTARLVEDSAETAWINGQYTTIVAWVRALPDELVRARPWICIWNAWSLTQMGSLENVSRWIDAAQQAAQRQGVDFSPGAVHPSPDAETLVYEIASLRALSAVLAEQYDRAVELAKPVLENAPAQNKKSAVVARCNIFHGLSSMYYATGQLDKAEQACLETIRASREIGFSLRYFHAVNKLAYVYQTSGNLHQVDRLLRDTRSYVEQQGMGHYFAEGVLYCRLVDLLYEWNQIEETRRIIREHLKPEMLAGVPYLMVDLYNIEARDLLRQQDFQGAQKALDQAAALARQSYIWPGLSRQTESLQVKLWLQQGENALAAAWASGQPSGSSEAPLFSSEYREIARARILLAQGAHREAIDLLDRLAGAADSVSRKGSLVQIRTLQAVALQFAGAIEQAVTAMESALMLAEPEGYTLTFVDEGNPIAALLSQIVYAKTSPRLRYAARLLAVFEEEKERTGAVVPDLRVDLSKTARDASSAVLIEPLSKRELEVLRCIANGLSNSETAQRLVIETSTVKRHINSIFSKLGVKNRVQALNKVREYHLL